MADKGLPNQGTIKQVEQTSYSDGKYTYVTETVRTEKANGEKDTYQTKYVEKVKK